MAEEKIKSPGYMTFREAAIMFSLMPEQDAATAIKATVNYYLYGTEAKLNGIAAQVFDIMRADIDRGNAKYRETVERNRKNGKNGGRPKKKKTQREPTGNPLES